ncbi:type IV pilus modification protein PilV [Halopseudomonas nanhaiensis]|uniref:type IV pilus modification protein PilV n=1 Tax=Halopseudomonas nanhaiensis TaxID=2830842 RepID=UPI001CBCF43C|nr:type IV pilus modification protein PilV [Halopseudomonas nanhaiensis]UAW99020.1 type IV pilus modification protein PilV [Halopseudomonas nanhaiensis]
MKRLQHGVSLIEVLVAVIVFSVGLLGLAALQLNAIRFNEGASVRGHAVFLAGEMADRIRARPETADLADYALAFCTDQCQPELTDHAEWLNHLRAQLPSGNGAVTVEGQKVTVTIRWSEERLKGSEAQAISVVTRI